MTTLSHAAEEPPPQAGIALGWGCAFGRLSTNEQCPRTATQIDGLDDIVAVAGGGRQQFVEDHGVLLRADGTVFTVGDNREGQLGTGNTNASATPVQVVDRSTQNPSGYLRQARAVDAGALHSLALKEDGTVVAWGCNGDGQLGTTTPPSTGQPSFFCTSMSPTPLQVKDHTGVGGLSRVKSMAAGAVHNLAIKADGTVWAWGSNSNGQLGNGSIVARGGQAVPTQVQGLGDVTAVAAGGAHSLAVKADGTVWTWGSNTDGQLGNGMSVPVGFTGQPVPMQVNSLSDVKAVAAGDGHSLAVKADGTVWAWGRNFEGQLGTGTKSGKSAPVQVAEVPASVAVTAGDFHSVALAGDGTVFAWGANVQGQLGDGTNKGNASPLQVKGLNGADAVAAGGSHSRALLGKDPASTTTTTPSQSTTTTVPRTPTEPTPPCSPEPPPDRPPRWGDLDPSFDCDGKVFTSLGEGEGARIEAVTVQPDGKIVAALTRPVDIDQSTRVFRYKPDGSLDTGFGNGGSATVGLKAYDIALQADGKIVVAGSVGFGSDVSPSNVGMARFNPDGSLDSGFGQNGLVTASLGPTNDGASGLAIQTDGKIVVAGYVDSVAVPIFAEVKDFAMARFNPDGSLDSGFGEEGKVTTRVDLTADDEANSVIVQPDGRIVAAGYTQGSSQGPNAGRRFVLVRYGHNGSLDSSFDGDGIVTTPFAPPGNENLSGATARDVALRSDGKIVAAGYARFPGGRDGTAYTDHFALAQYNPDGTLDTGFSGDGRVVTDVVPGNTDNAAGNDDRAYGVAIQADGAIVTAGESGDFFGGSFALARHRADGSLDPSFGADGRVATNFGNYERDVALQADGKIVAVGMAGAAPALARYLPDGSLDPGFGNGGTVTSRGPSGGGWNDMAVQPDGKVVVVGFGGGFALARYLPDGSLDTGFGNGGTVVTRNGNFSGARAVALQADGKIVVVGGFFSREVTVSRYNSDGSTDPSFGQDGTVVRVVGGSTMEGSGVAIQTDGKIVVVGSSGSLDGRRFLVLRYLSNGSTDPSFGAEGMVETSFGTISAARAQDVIVQNDGKIVAVGETDPGGVVGLTRDFAVARYNPNGSLDQTFNACGAVPAGPCGGVAATDLGGRNDGARSLVLQPDGKIVAAGFSANAGSNFAFALVRYGLDGKLDLDFNRCPPAPNTPCGGKVTTSIPGAMPDYAFANDVALQPDGKIVAAGTSPDGYNVPADIVLARYNADGTLESCPPGTVRTHLAPNSHGEAVAIQSDGKVLAAGLSSSREGGSSLTLVRYLRVDSGPPPTKVSISGDRVTEPATGTAEARLPVRLDAPACEQVRVDFTTADGSAKANQDYGPKTGSVIFEPGFDSATASVDVLADDEVEDNENFHVDLTRVGVGPAAPTDALPLPPGVLPGGRSLSVPDRRGTATIVDRDRSSQRGRTITPPPPPPPPAPEPPAALPPPPPPIQPPALPTLEPPPLGLGVPPPLTPPPAPVQPLTQPLTQAQQQGQQQAQQQIAQQVQQQMQAQLQAGFMLERERQAESERAGTERRDANPGAYLASERTSDPLPAPALTWGAAAAALGVGLAYRRRSVALAPARHSAWPAPPSMARTTGPRSAGTARPTSGPSAWPPASGRRSRPSQRR